MQRKSHSELFAAPADEQGIAEARAYVAEQGLTYESVKIIRHNGMVLVVTRRAGSPWSANNDGVNAQASSL